MLFHSLIVNHFEITNPYIIGLLSSLLIYVITTLSKMEYSKFFLKKFNFVKDTNYITLYQKEIDGWVYNDLYISFMWYISTVFDQNVTLHKKDNLYLQESNIEKNTKLFFNNKTIIVNKEYEQEPGYKKVIKLIIESKDCSPSELTSILKQIQQQYFDFIKTKDSLIMCYGISENNWTAMDIQLQKTWENVFLNNSLKENLKQDIINFKNSKKFYKEKGMSHSRGYYFYGSPGNGKTSLIKTMIKEFNKNSYMLNLDNIRTNSDFTKLSSYIEKSSIIILEDIDCTNFCFERNSQNQDLKKEKDSLTLSTILNFIDGVQENDYIFIMTTNHPEKLDPALTRPGRFDFQMELTNCSKKMFVEILKFYCDYDFKESDIDFPEFKYSTAFIINLCFTNRNDTEEIFKIINEKMQTENKN